MKTSTQREQRALNRDSREHWEQYSDHREAVQALIDVAHHSSEGRSLCVLGAGNCNDLDLRGLRGQFEEIVLIDIDPESTQDAIHRQGLEAPGSNITVLGHDLLTWSPSPDSTYDVVLSACVLTQLVLTATKISPSAPQRWLAIRDKHIDDVVKLTKPGGRVVFVTDIVSSETAPALSKLPKFRLAQAAGQLVADRNFFHGANHERIEGRLASRLLQVTRRRFWRWNMGPRTYLVVGWVFGEDPL